MKIAHLKISNFLKIKDVEMNPSKTNVIVGKNKQGKTSILKAIRAAFDGKIDESAIRIGESKAEITVELDDLIVHRTLTEKGTHLDISNKEGMRMPSPQKFLDGILGTFSFNPIEFFDKKPADRKKYLLNAIKINVSQDDLAAYTGEKLIGLDYDAHALEVVAAAHKHYYDQRTAANAEVTKKQKSLEDLNAQIPEGFDPRNVSEEQISKLRAAIQRDETEKVKAEAHLKHIDGLRKQEADIKEQITALQAKLKGVETEIVEALEVEFSYSDDLALQAAKDTVAALESQRETVFTVKRAAEVRGELDLAIKQADKLDAIVKKLAKEVPEDLIKKAKLPIEGLAIEGDSIKVNGVDIDNMSSSEQMRFGLEVVRALNGDFKVVCVDGLEMLDKESFEAFLKETENDDFAYFCTRVDGAAAERNGISVIEIADGEIVKKQIAKQKDEVQS